MGSLWYSERIPSNSQDIDMCAFSPCLAWSDLATERSLTELRIDAKRFTTPVVSEAARLVVGAPNHLVSVFACAMLRTDEIEQTTLLGRRSERSALRARGSCCKLAASVKSSQVLVRHCSAEGCRERMISR